MSKAIKYPKECYEQRIQGKVLVAFVVNEEGLVEDAVVEEGIGGGCDEEALRVVRLARFTPGRTVRPTPDGNQYSDPVKVHMMLPITFSIETLSRRQRRQLRRAQKAREDK